MTSDREGTTNHEIYDRLGRAEVSIGRVETELGSLSRQFSNLAEAVDSKVGSLQSMIHSIDSKLGGVGKISGQQLAGLGASLIGALALLGSIFVAPLRTEMAGMSEMLKSSHNAWVRETDDLGARIYQHAQLDSHPKSGERYARVDERVENLKAQMAIELQALKEQLRAEQKSVQAEAWNDYFRMRRDEERKQ